MPVQAWAGADDLSFVHGRRPRDLRELLKADRRWAALFSRWYMQKCPSAKPEWRGDWMRLVDAGANSRTLQEAMKRAKTGPMQYKHWDALVKKDFFNTCDAVRRWLDEARDQAREDVEREGKLTSWYQYTERERAIEKRQQSQMRAAATPKPEEMEAQIAATTRSLKPRFRALFQAIYDTGIANEGTNRLTDPDKLVQHLSMWTGREEAQQRLGAAYTRLISAEASLRYSCRTPKVFTGFVECPTCKNKYRVDKPHSCGVAMRPVSDAESLGDRNEPEPEVPDLSSAWEEYAEACSSVADVMHDVCRKFVDWGESYTEALIRANFPSVHPWVATAQMLLRLSMTALTGLVEALGVMAITVEPVVGTTALAATSGLWVALDLIERLTIKSVAHADSKNPSVTEQHLGCTYEKGLPDALGDELNTNINTFYQPFSPLFKHMASFGDSSSAGLLQSAPFAGVFWRTGGAAKTATEVYAPRTLTPTQERDKLLRASRTAREGLQPTASWSDVRAAGKGRKMVNGVAGELKEGRFQPDDRTYVLAETIRNWQWANRHTASGVGLEAFGHSGAEAWFRLCTQDSSPLDWPDATSALLPNQAEDSEMGGFLCRTHAFQSLPAPELATSLWEVEFFLTYEGEALFRSMTEFCCMERSPAERPGFRVIATDFTYAEKLWNASEEAFKDLPVALAARGIDLTVLYHSADGLTDGCDVIMNMSAFEPYVRAL